MCYFLLLLSFLINAMTHSEQPKQLIVSQPCWHLPKFQMANLSLRRAVCPSILQGWTLALTISPQCSEIIYVQRNLLSTNDENVTLGAGEDS